MDRRDDERGQSRNPPDLQAAFTADHRLRFAVPVDDALICDWMRVVGADHDPRTLGRRLFDVPGHTHALTVTEVGPTRIVVVVLGTRIVVAHPDGGPSFEAARTLDREASWIHMDFTRVAPALQGRGIGTTLAGNGYRLARSLGRFGGFPLTTSEALCTKLLISSASPTW